MGVGGWTLQKDKEGRSQDLFQSRQEQVQGGQGLAGVSVGVLTTALEGFSYQSPAVGCLHQAATWINLVPPETYEQSTVLPLAQQSSHHVGVGGTWGVRRVEL